MASQWFGKARGTQFEIDAEHVQTPVGRACAWCEAIIDHADYGVMQLQWVNNSGKPSPLHFECHIRSIVGGLNHQLGRCGCCGGSEPPDPQNMTARQAAIAAAEHWRKAEE